VERPTFVAKEQMPALFRKRGLLCLETQDDVITRNSPTAFCALFSRLNPRRRYEVNRRTFISAPGFAIAGIANGGCGLVPKARENLDRPRSSRITSDHRSDLEAHRRPAAYSFHALQTIFNARLKYARLMAQSYHQSGRRFQLVNFGLSVAFILKNI